MANPGRQPSFLASETRSLPRRPRQLAPADDVQVQVVHRLAPILPVVDHHAEPAGALLGANLPGNPEQVTQEGLLVLTRLGELAQAVHHLGDHLKEWVGGTARGITG